MPVLDRFEVFFQGELLQQQVGVVPVAGAEHHQPPRVIGGQVVKDRLDVQLGAVAYRPKSRKLIIFNYPLLELLVAPHDSFSRAMAMLSRSSSPFPSLAVDLVASLCST